MALESIAVIHAKKGRKSDKYCQTLNLCQILENHAIKLIFSGYGFLNRYFDIYYWYNSEMVWWKPLVDLTWNHPPVNRSGSDRHVSMAAWLLRAHNNAMQQIRQPYSLPPGDSMNQSAWPCHSARRCHSLRSCHSAQSCHLARP